MSYAVVRVQKMTAGSVRGIQIHDRREKENSRTNPDIDHNRSRYNYDLCPDQHEDFGKAVKERIAQLDLPKAVRKDAVVMAQVLVTSDSAFFKGLGADREANYMEAAYRCYGAGDPFTESYIEEQVSLMDKSPDFFQAAYDFLADRYGRENVISATVHMDEKTPHMHFNFVPITEDGRLCAKEILTPKTLTEQQDAFHEQIGKHYGLERGEPRSSGKRRTHLQTADFKKYAALEQEAAERAQRATAAAEKLEVDVYHLRGEMNLLGDQVASAQASLAAAKQEKSQIDKALENAHSALTAARSEAKQAAEELEYLRMDKNATEGTVRQLEDRLKRLEERWMTAKQVEALEGKKTLTGSVKGISYADYDALRRTAAAVDKMRVEKADAEKKAQAAEARAIKAEDACGKASMKTQLEMVQLKKDNRQLDRLLDGMLKKHDFLMDLIQRDAPQLYQKLMAAEERADIKSRQDVLEVGGGWER